MPHDIYRSYSLKPHAIGMIVLLTIQYLLGEFSSLFIDFPKGKQTAALWGFAWQQIPLALHIVIGLLLLLGTLALFIRAFIVKDKAWTIASFAGLIAIFGAVISGVIFIPTQKDVYSFTMALYFIIGLFAYFWGVYQSK